MQVYRFHTIVLTCLFLSLSLASNLCAEPERRLFPVCEGDKWGFIDGEGNMIVEPQFKAVGDLDDVAPVAKDGDDWVRVKPDGKVIPIPGTKDLERLFPAAEGLYIGFDEHLAKTVVDTEGQIDRAAVISSEIGDGLIPCKSGKQWGFIGRNGEWRIKPKFDLVGGFSGGVATVRADDRWGIIDTDGKYIVEPFYHAIWNSSEGLLLAAIGRQFTYLRRDGTQAFDCTFIEADIFTEGLARVREAGNELWGFIDREGEYQIEPKFVGLTRRFSEGMTLATAKIDGREVRGFFDRDGKLVLPCNHLEKANPFNGGLARVRTRNIVGYMNTEGEWVWAAARTESHRHW